MVDMSKYRRNSSFYKYEDGNVQDSIRNAVIDQAVEEFDLYQKYAPNTHKIYVNDSPVPILGTLIDVSDLEIGSDSKWLLTSIKHDISAGDILTIGVRKWLCIYDKEKNTQNCNKVKIQPCTYPIKIAVRDLNNTPLIYESHSIVTTYLTDTKEFKQPFPTESGTSFVSMQYNEFTKQIKRESRLWLFDEAFRVNGEDFTNIDFYKNRGYLKFTLRPDNKSRDLDNYDLKVCDYYKYFNKDITTPTIPPPKDFNLTVSSQSVKLLKTVNIQAINVPNGEKVMFDFVGKSMQCTIPIVTSDSCVLKAGGEIGIVYVKAYLESNPEVTATTRITIEV